jgi:hypothetical protein
MKTLFLAWQAPEPTRAWFPIGRLDAAPEQSYYRFRYTHGALEAQKQTGMAPLMAFPEFQRNYESPELFPLFKNRVISSSRRDFPEYLGWLGLDAAHSDPIAMLAVTGGERTTDNLEVFPKVEKDTEGNFKVRFFLHGMRHVSLPAKERGSQLKDGENLRVMVEMDNPVTRLALALHTDDYQMVGWAPRYLVRDIMTGISKSPLLAAHVVKVNEGPVPLNRRVLVEMCGRANDGFDPMTTPDFLPLIEG